jgi:hypothetical protein
MKESTSVLMNQIQELLHSLESNLPKNLDAMAVSGTPKLPWKALLYRECLIWRMAELGRGAFDSFEKDRIVSAIIFTRAAVETSAALWYLYDKIAVAVNTDTVGDIDAYLMRLSVGTGISEPTTDSTKSAPPRAIRVRDFRKAVDKDIPEFSHQYGILCDYAHPNWAGTGLSYCQHDTEQRRTNFGANIRKADNSRRIGLGNLSAALTMFELKYNQIADLLPSFIALCEIELKLGANARASDQLNKTARG